MNTRKKKGIVCLVSGIIFVVGGLLLFTQTATPSWFPTAIQIIGAIGSIFGFTFVYPDTD